MLSHYTSSMWSFVMIILLVVEFLLVCDAIQIKQINVPGSFLVGDGSESLES